MNGKHQFLKRAFRPIQVNHLTDIDTEFTFDHDVYRVVLRSREPFSIA